MPAYRSPAPSLVSSSLIRYVSSWRRSPRSRFAIRNLKPSGLRRSTPASLFQQRQGRSAIRPHFKLVAEALFAYFLAIIVYASSAFTIIIPHHALAFEDFSTHMIALIFVVIVSA